MATAPAGPTVVVVTYNSAASIGECLDSIAECAPAASVVVVDNASVDATVAIAERSMARPLVIRNDANLGFARAVNIGLARAAGPLVLILNPDCRLQPDALEQLDAELARFPECAIVGPRVLNADLSVQGSARGDPTLLTGLFGRSSLLTKLFPRSPWARRNVRTQPQAAADSAPFDTDWLSGACMLARRDALAAIGGFDERYFLYWEDADLCRRLRQRGHTIRYVPAAAVVHTGGVSSESAKALATRAFHQSAYTYYATHVAPGPVARVGARALLALRCRWKLLGVR